MKPLLTLTLALTASGTIFAQPEPSDTVASSQLEDFVVEAPKVVRKADMDVYHPSKSAVDNSKNGMQLINNLMIPTLNVNDVLGSVQAAGQSVQLRINGRVASIDQVKALLPETVKRVEWIDNPGLRYNGANYVLNIIVTNPTLGGSLMLQASPMLNQKFGNYFADAKFNIGRSQWSIGANYKMTQDIKTHRDYIETFTFPDGQSVTRTETPTGGSLDNSQGNAWMSYSYIKPDTTVFYVSLNAFGNLDSRSTYEGRLSYSDGSRDINLFNESGSKGCTPSLSVYLEQTLPRNQKFVVDFGASLYAGRSFSSYIEQVPESDVRVSDVNTSIKDRNQAYAIEADYIKNWKSSRLTGGVTYSANRNRSIYENLDNEVFHQRQDKVYFFTEYFQRLNKFTLTAGLGAQYTSFRFRESNQGQDSWNLRPQATLTYSLNSRHRFRLNFTSWQSAPSLSETNIVPVQTDGFQWRVGNPDLKTSSSYMLTLRYSFTFPRVSGTFGVRGFTSPDAITPVLQWEGDKLVTTYENSRGLQNVSIWIAPQIEIIPTWLTFSGTLQYRGERMRGTGYKLYNHGLSGSFSAMLTHWGFALAIQYNKAQRNLWGEKISWGEDISIIDLRYNWKAWEFGAGMLMPFGKYDQGSKMLSKWNTNEQHLRLDMSMVYVSLAYNLQWGRQKRGANKLINANANADKSSTGSR